MGDVADVALDDLSVALLVKIGDELCLAPFAGFSPQRHILGLKGGLVAELPESAAGICLVRFGLVIGAAYGGIKAPELFLVNTAKKRQTEIRKAWPDALDLTLICVESGMAIEHAFRKVSTEIAGSSVVLAEELALMTAEMSFLPDRRQAYENLVLRTGLDPVKAVATALIQAERYGTPVGQALRVLSQESRDQRMNEAEKKAAGLPPKLTVPMILFFLPVLFVVIITPAVIQIMRTQ